MLWVLLLVMLLGVIACGNQASNFHSNEVYFGYGDGYYISQTSNNLINGEGYSYWNGYNYVFWDYEISTGPTIIYPQALAQLIGIDKYTVFFYVPLALHLLLFFALLVLWKNRLDRDLFYAASGLITLFFLSFYQWFWYLPLGEIQALLWLLMALTVILAGKDRSHFFVAGVFSGLALLSKMMMVLALPLLFIYLLMRISLLAAVKFLGGVILICGLFVLSIYWSAPAEIDIQTFVAYFFVFIKHSFGWAFPEVYLTEKLLEIGVINKFFIVLQTLNEPFGDSDKMGFYFFGGLSAFAATLMLLSLWRRPASFNIYVALLLLALLGAYFAWAFVIGLKSFRYSFVFFSMLLLFAVFLGRFLGRAYLPWVSAVLVAGLIAVIAVRGLIYPVDHDDVRKTQQAAQSFEQFSVQQELAHVYITDQLYLPYLNLAYFLERPDMLQAAYHYIDTLPLLAGLDECRALQGKPEFIYFYHKNPYSPASWCRTQKITLRFDFQKAPAEFWLLDYGEHGNDAPICRDLQWQSGNYYLYQCDRQEFAAFIERDSGGFIQLEGK